MVAVDGEHGEPNVHVGVVEVDLPARQQSALANSSLSSDGEQTSICPVSQPAMGPAVRLALQACLIALGSIRPWKAMVHRFVRCRQPQGRQAGRRAAAAASGLGARTSERS